MRRRGEFTSPQASRRLSCGREGAKGHRRGRRRVTKKELTDGSEEFTEFAIPISTGKGEKAILTGRMRARLDLAQQEEIAAILADALVADIRQHPELYPSLWRTRMDGTGLTRTIAELVCLVYHDARNVRHPIKAGKLPDGTPYAKLVVLPRNRLEAWRAMAAVRERAGQRMRSPAGKRLDGMSDLTYSA